MNLTQERWRAGRCPCCGAGRDNDGLDGTGPVAVAEGVWFCGWCAERGHADDDMTVPVLLADLVGQPR